MNNKLIPIIAAVVIVIVAVWLLVASFYKKPAATVPDTTQQTQTNQDVNTVQDSTSSSAPAVSDGLADGQTYGFILTPQTGVTGKADGSVTYKDGTLTFGIRVQGLPEPAAGKFYEAWLINGATATPLSALTHPTDASMKKDFTLGYQVKQPNQNYDKVVVSLESNNDSTIEVPLFEGLVKQSK